MIKHEVKETRQQNEQGGEVWVKFEKRRVSNIAGSS